MLGTYPQDIYKEVKELNIPTVLTDVYEYYTSDFHSINTDDIKASYIATKHLIDYGHTKIGFVGGSIKDSPIHNNRYLGFGKAMMEANIKINSDCIYETQTTFEGGQKLADKLLKEDIPVTGLVVDADIVALGIMKTFLDRGYNIPDTLSIVGFDDIQAASFISPGLTTVRQFISKKAQLAAELVIEDILSNKITMKTEMIPSKLIIRGSTKKIDK